MEKLKFLDIIYILKKELKTAEERKNELLKRYSGHVPDCIKSQVNTLDRTINSLRQQLQLFE